MTERTQLEETIAALEKKRDTLGDAVIDKAVAPLRERLTVLEAELKAGADTTIQTTTSAAGERRVVTILFCDVKGSTSMAENLDPEEWSDIMKRAYQYLIEPVIRHGGIVARLLGDGLLAFFGAPVAHEDDSQRAVLAGLEIIEGIQSFQVQLKREHGLDFNVRVGINTGLVVVGDVGAGQQVEYTAMGDAINLAARMEQTARPGTVQITEQTYQLIEPIFECQPLGEIMVKGKRKPIRSYRVIGRKAQPGPLRGLERQGLQSRLVGREAEFAVIEQALNRLLVGQGGIIGIIGEAGIGKSRLIWELRQVATAGRFTWLEGHTLSYGQTISYWPFRAMLRQFCRIYEEDSEAEALDKLEAQVGELLPDEKGTVLPYLAHLMALETGEAFSQQLQFMDADALGKNLFQASRRFFQRLATNSAVILIFEDLHWIDESSSRLLEHLFPLAESRPLLIIGLSRPYRNTAAARLQRIASEHYASLYTELRLEPLSREESLNLVQSLLKSQGIPPRLAETIAAKAGGNPFFLEEIIRNLIESGAVVREVPAGGWRVTEKEGKLVIPDTIQGVIMARIDRLEAEIKQALRLASVIGYSFLYSVLREIADEAGRLDSSLEELIQLELILIKQRLPELEYLFKHALVQEVTYESILLQKRRKLHHRVGSAIESLFPGRLEEFCGLLAYHYAKAEVWDKAQYYLLRAGDQAGRMAADTEALAYYSRAIEIYGLAFGDRWDPVQRAALERKIGEAHWRRGEYAQASEHLSQGLRQLGRSLPDSRWEIRLGILKEAARQLGHRLLHRIQPAGPPPGIVEEVLIYECITWIDGFTRPERFLLGSLRELNTAEQYGFELGIVLASTGFGLTWDFSSQYRLAELYHRQALRLAEGSKNPTAMGLAYYGWAAHHLCLGHFELVAEHAQKCAEAYQQAGDLHGYLLGVLLGCYARARQGFIHDTLKQIPAIVEHCRESADRLGLAQAQLLQGLVYCITGTLEEAVAYLRESLDLASQIPDHISHVMAMGELGRAYTKMGRFQQAIELLKTSHDFARQHHIEISYVRSSSFNGLAEACLLAAERGEMSGREDRLKRAEQACWAALRFGKRAPGGMPEAMRLKGTNEWLNGKPVAARKWWQRGLSQAKRMGLRYEQGMAHFEIGLRLGEREHSEQAQVIFAEIGAELDLAMARKSASS